MRRNTKIYVKETVRIERKDEDQRNPKNPMGFQITQKTQANPKKLEVILLTNKTPNKAKARLKQTNKPKKGTNTLTNLFLTNNLNPFKLLITLFLTNNTPRVYHTKLITKIKIKYTARLKKSHQELNENNNKVNTLFKM